MNFQRPDRNNPTNPLLKVAALTLDAEDLGTLTPTKQKKIRRILVVVSLNFKQSNDLRGNAKADDGRPISVCFSMSIRRASFELAATFEDRGRKLPRITNVAFLSPLEVKYSVSDETVVRHGSEKGYEVSGSGALNLSEIAAGMAGHGRAVGKAKSGAATKKVRTKKGAFHQTNVSVTYGGNLIHWELTLANTKSSDLDELAKAADLDPRSGDLSDVDLSGLDLSGQDLSGWNLKFAKLANAKLTGTKLRDAALNVCELIQAIDWRRADLDDKIRNVAIELAELPYNPNLLIGIPELGFRTRTKRLLETENIAYVGDLVRKTEVELLRIEGLGKKALNEIKEALVMRGIHLGMVVDDWPPNNLMELAKLFKDQA
jgi:hypothetical protein